MSKLLRTADTRFVFRSIPGEVTFRRNAAGVVEGAILHFAQGEQQLEILQ